MKHRIKMRNKKLNDMVFELKVEPLLSISLLTTSFSKNLKDMVFLTQLSISLFQRDLLGRVCGTVMFSNLIVTQMIFLLSFKCGTGD